MNDMTRVIVPKSDQMNADDLIPGPRTITITEVSIRPGTEQPVSIYFDGDDGKPFKPCKSMCRVMVTAWGPDANQYVGRSMTLYRDPTVKWGGMAIGGIRISHMSDIERDLAMTLTATKGKWAPYKVHRLTIETPKPSETKRRTWADVFPEIERDLNACRTSDEVSAIAARDLIQKGLEKPESETAKRLNAMIKAALDRFAEPTSAEPSDFPGDWSDEAAP